MAVSILTQGASTFSSASIQDTTTQQTQTTESTTADVPSTTIDYNTLSSTVPTQQIQTTESTTADVPSTTIDYNTLSSTVPTQQTQTTESTTADVPSTTINYNTLSSTVPTQQTQTTESTTADVPSTTIDYNTLSSTVPTQQTQTTESTTADVPSTTIDYNTLSSTVPTQQTQTTESTTADVPSTTIDYLTLPNTSSSTVTVLSTSEVSTTITTTITETTTSQVFCSDPEPVPSGVVLSTGPYIANKSKAVYSCLSGYRMHGNPAIACRSGGTWQGQLPVCALESTQLGNSVVINNNIDVNNNVSVPNRIEIKASSPWLIPFLVTTIFFLVLLTGVAVYCIKKFGRRRGKSPRTILVKSASKRGDVPVEYLSEDTFNEETIISMEHVYRNPQQLQQPPISKVPLQEFLIDEKSAHKAYEDASNDRKTNDGYIKYENENSKDQDDNYPNFESGVHVFNESANYGHVKSVVRKQWERRKSNVSGKYKVKKSKANGTRNQRKIVSKGKMAWMSLRKKANVPKTKIWMPHSKHVRNINTSTK